MSRNMQNTMIKIIAGILVAMMVLSILPVSGFAEEAGENTDVVVEEPAMPETTEETEGTEEIAAFEAAYADTQTSGTLVWEDGEWHYYNEDGVFDQTKTGLVDYNGGRFYVVNGVLAGETNGLTLIDGIWYFLANGQLQAVTQWAEYDGYWFYITAGILDTTKNGLMPYNGGEFLVAAGQIKKDVSGLWLNEVALGGDGSWYYLSNGQVQNQYTGLAQYDGEWFYVIDGMLAGTFIGIVEYNGSRFYIVNGMLAKDYTGIVEYQGTRYQVEKGVVTGEVPEPVWNPDIVFTTTDLYGNEYTDRIFADAEVTMLNLWAYWCGPCVGELQDLQRLQNNYANRGFQIYGVSYDNYTDGNREEFEWQEITYPSLIVPPSLEDLYWDWFGNRRSFPTTIFVDGNGHILGEPYVGARSYSDWAAIVEGYLG